jgi:hypothetical protein
VVCSVTRMHGIGQYESVITLLFQDGQATPKTICNIESVILGSCDSVIAVHVGYGDFTPFIDMTEPY